ncbi:AraC family transcriptional regulator [Seongchinamella unica]|uniref:AraC family transcriptional regulator n=1 Tax=Seongchinamella unica TaxID=2547392 RepID=A0A4R5LT92_9GAMM|nr:AraC family transcriptional regulator [Seongchinamella unica]TDG14086.1 AraC family transcriptional regulator [Seongchinamella unica]
MKPYIRGGILEHFADTAAPFGVDVNSLLCEADVAPEVLTLPGVFLPYGNYMRLLHLAAQRTGAEHFGLLMARASNAETLGTIGITMTQAKTVSSAWETLEHFYSIHDTYGHARMQRHPDASIISYALPCNDQPGSRQVFDVAAGVTSNIMRRLCGPDFQAESVSFPYSEPADVAPYADLPCKRISFGASAMEVEVAAHWMAQPLQGRSEELRLALDAYLTARGRVPKSAGRQVEDMIRTLLPTGDCSLPRVAATLATSPRTLQSRLENEQCSFRDILERVRREIAIFHLRRGDMQLTQLAMVLGYSELSAFSRSFRGWYGKSPRDWARQEKWQETM